MCAACVVATRPNVQDEDVPQGAAWMLTHEETAMDEQSFDAVATALADHQSRRGFARLAAGVALASLAAGVARQVAAAKADANSPARGAATMQPKRPHPAAADARAAAHAAKARPARHPHRCRYSQTICSRNGQCCPSTSGFICAWNGNNEGTTVCCGVNGARCLGDYDCCNQAICVFGVCVG
jgi:hypothetical protein